MPKLDILATDRPSKLTAQGTQTFSVDKPRLLALVPLLFNGIAYKTDNDEDFFSKDGKLVELIAKVVSLNGTLNSEFTNFYNGKLALFKHPNSINSNWVRNGIDNL